VQGWEKAQRLGKGAKSVEKVIEGKANDLLPPNVAKARKVRVDEVICFPGHILCF
jgi:hypothetical protein